MLPQLKNSVAWAVPGIFWVMEKETGLSSVGRVPNLLLLKEHYQGFPEDWFQRQLRTQLSALSLAFSAQAFAAGFVLCFPWRALHRELWAEAGGPRPISHLGLIFVIAWCKLLRVIYICSCTDSQGVRSNRNQSSIFRFVFTTLSPSSRAGRLWHHLLKHYGNWISA